MAWDERTCVDTLLEQIQQADVSPIICSQSLDQSRLHLLSLGLVRRVSRHTKLVCVQQGG
jgi:hypothetical protein